MSVMNFFSEAIKHHHLSHSYLMVGSADDEIAKQIAKMILCKQEHTGCGSCSSCKKLDSGNHPDLLMITPDGASIKNEQIESFQEFIFIRPFESDYKIVIFNEAHLMTDRAQNRMLKVLEEPPEYAVFLLLTCQPELLLDTVKSRCQTFIISDLTSCSQTDDAVNKAVDLIYSICKQDGGRIFEYGHLLKQDKTSISAFLYSFSSVLRDVLVFRETHNYQLIHNENLSILNYKEVIRKSSECISRKLNLELIQLIEEIDQKIKSNMNFDLTVDKLLFKCLNREA